MCEVTNDNFEELLPSILACIDRADFLAFDCEFTALNPDSNIKNSLFDNVEERFKKLAHPAIDSVISQFGLSMFEQDLDTNKYIARTYNFFICPRSFASVDDRFGCQASSLEFLMRYNFDFNKFLYKGISYLNYEQEERLRRDLLEGALIKPLDRNIPFQDEEKIREICGELASWVNQSKVGDSKEVELGLVAPFVLHVEIRRKFPLLWSYSTGNIFFVKKVSPDEKLELEKGESEKELAKKLLDTMLGFTKVIRHIVSSHKPIIGHNCLLDLIKIYKQFIGPVPGTYKQFKEEIHSLFPCIFDTKHICYSVKKRISKVHPDLEHVFSSSNLNLLHEVLVQRNDTYTLWSPTVIHDTKFDAYERAATPHEAGYDAFLAGFCFIKIGHLAATISYMDIKKMRVLAFREKLDILEEYCNCVNIARAVTNHVNLGGIEPDTNRPKWLYVKSKMGRLDAIKLAEKLAKYACSDIRRIGLQEAIVAVSTHRGVRDILVSCAGSEEWRVEKYNLFQHNKKVRGLLWGGVVLGISLGVGLVWKEIAR